MGGEGSVTPTVTPGAEGDSGRGTRGVGLGARDEVEEAQIDRVERLVRAHGVLKGHAQRDHLYLLHVLGPGPVREARRASLPRAA